MATLTLPRFLSLSLLVVLSFSSTSSAQCNPADKRALLQIQADFRYPDALSTWNSPASGDCCNWTGIDCLGTGRVRDLYIYYSNISGLISPAIGKLSKLQTLRLDGNAFTGPVPSFLARLTELDYLNLAANKLSGTIPDFLADLPLTLLQLDHNRLTGPLPASLARSSADYLYLSSNDLTGHIPASFASAGFEIIDLSRNRLTGDASILFGGSKPLQRLYLSRNRFEFDLTRVVFPENMTTLVLDHNSIYGSIPPQITELHKLQFVNVSYNQLCGEIPSGGRMGRFRQYAFLHNKCLCGQPLPACN